MAEGSSKDLEDWLKSLNPDLIVVYSMSQLLKPNIFTIPRYGTINLHPSLLPNYRGPNPWFWMYYDNNLQAGVTVHYVDDGEDTGDIIYQESFGIPPGALFQQVCCRAIEDIGLRLLIRAIDDIASGDVEKQKQQQMSPTQRARNVRPDEGSRLIDWEHWPVQRIWHFLRGAAHWTNVLPEMKGIYQGQNWMVDQYETCSMDSNYTVGRIYKENGNFFLVCKDGKIILRKCFSTKHFILHLLFN
jgi:methionyl-tRNA formyltransferase